MGKENNLKDYLKDLYLGIASKKPDTSKNPQDFRSEIESLVFPEGTKAITNNGTHDIAQYKYASVNVSAPTPTTEEKTVTPTTSKQEITATNADYLSKVTVNAIPTTTQATPSISIDDSTGEITSSVTQTAGYVSAGTKSATKQLSTQAGKTVTPSSTEQTAVASGVYTTGEVKVAAVPTETKSVAPSTSAQTVTPSTGKFLSSVSVSAIATETKTVSPSTTAQTVTPTSGKYLTKVTVNAIPTVTQATPSISVSSSGLITASATQSAGYVSSGTKSATKQLTTKSAQTYTPTTSNQTISSGRYLTGTQTIKGDSNLVASNIKKGVSIFGVAGTYEGSGGTIPTTVKCYLSIGSAPSGFSTVEYTGPNGQALYDFQNSVEVELTVIPGSLLTISFADAMMGGGAMGDLLHYELYWNVGNTFCAITVPPEDFMLFATY